MEIKKAIKVPVDIKEPHFTGVPAQQESEMVLISEVEMGNSYFFIFNNKSFFGHGTTAGVRIDKFEDTNHISIYFKAALCSPEDRFNPATGEEIVLGRLIKADAEEPKASLALATMEDDEVGKTITTMITSFLSSLGELIVKRDESFGLMEIPIQLQKHRYQILFNKYK